MTGTGGFGTVRVHCFIGNVLLIADQSGMAIEYRKTHPEFDNELHIDRILSSDYPNPNTTAFKPTPPPCGILSEPSHFIVGRLLLI